MSAAQARRGQARKRGAKPSPLARGITALADGAIDAMVCKTLDGIITHWNPAADRLFGYTAAEAVGRNVLELLVPADLHEEEAAIFARIAAGELVPHFETRRLHRDGSPRHVSVALSPLRGPRGQIVGASTVIRDLTEQKRVERALADAQARLHQATQATGIGIWDFDPVSGHLEWDDTMLSLYGYDRAGLTSVYEVWRAAVHPDDRGETERALMDALAGGPPYDMSFRIVTPEGRVRHIQAKAHVFFDAQGRATRMLGTNYDVTRERLREQQFASLNATLERQVTERTEQLSRSSALRRAVLAEAAVAIIATDLQGTITLFNPAAERLLGYHAEEVVGIVSPAIIHDPAEVAARAAVLSEELGIDLAPGFEVFVVKARRGVADSNEWTYIRKDGSRVPVQLSVSVLRDEAGAMFGYLGIAADLTERKAREAALSERTAEAELASAAKSQFLANMSHEIRSPMNAILGMLQLLLNTGLTGRQADYAVKARRATESLLRLLNDILDFSRIEAERMTLESAPFSVDGILRDVSVLLSASIGDKPVELVFAIDPAIPAVLLGDAFRLRQVLLNLGGNAIKFTADGTVTVRVDVVSCEADRFRLAFSVKDTGIGIASDKLAAIFDGFVQAEASTTRRYGGSGLGLAISHRLVALMGGELRVESRLGEGSRFGFTLDFTSLETDAAGARARLPAMPRGRRVLVVDDHDEARQSVIAMLRSLEWSAEGAASGGEALAMVARALTAAPFETVLMDWRMPGRDGWETAALMRENLAGAGAPSIFIMSAYDREDLYRRAQGRPGLIDGILVKPFTASMLVDALRGVAAAGLADPRQATTASQGGRLAGLRVLVVEDNELNQQVARELLVHEGATVALAASGEAAIERVLGASPPFEAVLMDIQMPGMDGYEATRRLRQAGPAGLLPIIAMTANVMASDRAESLDAGMNDHIAKPIDVDVVVRTLLMWCRPGDATTAPPRDGGVGVDGGADVIDVESALRRLAGRTGLFAEVAGRFLVDAPVMLARLRADVARQCWADGAAILHQVKGLAATVGHHSLAALAADLERRLKTDPPGEALDAQLDRFEALFAAGRAALEALIERFTPAAPAPGDIELTGETALLNELDALLRESDMHAVTLWDRLCARLGETDRRRFQQVGVAIGHLDFAAASAALTGIRDAVPS